MKYLIGTDIGTSGTKSILMDTNGKLIAQDLEEYDVLTPKPLWAEQWPDVWVKVVRIQSAPSLKVWRCPEDIKGMGTVAFTVAQVFQSTKT